jgi:ribosomal protein S18 acetylase RimI-like enzyme
MSYQIRLATLDDAPGIARVHVDGWRHAYAHILPEAYLDALSYGAFESRWRTAIEHEDIVLIAADGDQVLGFAVYGPNRFPEVDCDGELQAIYVHPSAHRRGIGKALLREAADRLCIDGYSSMVVFLFRDNHQAAEFYVGMGAEFGDSGEYQVDGVYYPDVSYIWRSLRDLRTRFASGKP